MGARPDRASAYRSSRNRRRPRPRLRLQARVRSIPAGAGMTISLRPYQAKAVAEIAAAEQRRLMLVAPTGSGKTVIAAEVIREAGAHVLFLAHRRELIFQTR